MKLNKGWGVAAIVLGCVLVVSAANHILQPAQYIAREVQEVGKQFGHNMEEFGANMDQFGRMVDQFANDYENFDAWYEHGAITKVDTKTVAIDGVKKVFLDNRVGKVRVTGSADAKNVTITSTKRLRLNLTEEETRRYFDDIKILANRDGESLRIETELEEDLDANVGFNRMVAVDYEVTLPKGMQLEIVNQVGEVYTVGMAAAVYAELSVGRIDVNGYAGTLHLQNNTGEITARGGTDIKEIDVRSNIGAVHLYIPKDANLFVDAETNIGNLETDFSELDVDLQVPGKEVDGRLGDGTGNLHVRTNTGAIDLLKE